MLFGDRLYQECVYWLSSCVHWLFDEFVQRNSRVSAYFLFWYQKNVYWLCSVSCKQLIVWFVLYLKSVHTKYLRVLCNETGECWQIFCLFWYLKSVYSLSSVSCTWGVLTDCLVWVVHEECSLIYLMVLGNKT